MSAHLKPATRLPLDVTPPCADKGYLFESPDPGAHKLAAVYCEGCPVFKACGDNRDALVADRHPIIGTWAGVLYGKLGRPVKVRAS